jgi:hypothetical protein
VRVEIVQELEADDGKLEVPWANPEDPLSHYVDLKAHPDEIDQLEECRRFPALGELLRAANSSRSPFRTAKCDVWGTTELSEDERLDFKLPCKVGSYVDLFLDQSDYKYKRELHVQVAEKLRQLLSPLRVQAQMEICVRQALYHPEPRWGYYLTCFLHAYGADPGEAAEEWRRAIRALGHALTGIERPHGETLAKRADGASAT